MKIKLILFVACWFIYGCGIDSLQDTASDSSGFANASLIVESPLSGEIYMMNEALELRGKIVNKEADVLEFVDLVWRTDLLETPIAVGAAEEVSLQVGIHSISATAELPNGDRLKETLGGIRIQSPLTGIYSGNVSFDVSDFDALTDMLGGGGFGGAGFGGGEESESPSDNEESPDTPIESEENSETGMPDLSNLTASCVGGLDFVIDMEGKNLEGGGECSLNLLVTNLDLSYSVDGTISENEINGEVSISLGFLPVSFEWQGTFQDNKLEGKFEGETFLFNLDGELNARRLTQFIEVD